MDSETTRKIIVAGSMAGVLALGILLFAARQHPAASVAVVSAPPAPTADNMSPAPAETVQPPPAPTPAPSLATTPTSPAVAPARVVDATPAPARPRAKQNSSAATTPAVVTPSVPAEVAAASDAENAKAADASQAPAVADTAGPAAGTSTGNADSTPSDPQITSEVKSVLALDSVAKDSDIAVNTSHGVVALTGSVPDQSALDHVVDAVAKVKYVVRVDASAVMVTNL